MNQPIGYLCAYEGCPANRTVGSPYCVFHKDALTPTPAADDCVNHPQHYTSHPSGVECIQVTEHFNFNIGNAVKYLWRAGLKGKPLEDLQKARWYVDREIKRLGGA